MKVLRTLLVTAAALAICSGSFPARAAWWKTDKSGQPAAPLLTAQTAQWKTVAGGYELQAESTAESTPAPLLIAKAGRPLVLQSRAPTSGDCELRAVVRLRALPKSYGGARFTLGRREGDADSGVSVVLLAHPANQVVACSVETGDHKPLYDVKAMAAKLPWTPQIWPTYNYQPRAYTQFLPGWPAAFRAAVEDAMSKLPDRDDKLIEVHVKLRRGSVGVWVDDRLIGRKQDTGLAPGGFAQIELYPGTQLVSYRLMPLVQKEPAGFLPLPLAGYANARGFDGEVAVAPSTLPPAGQVVKVRNIPFVFPGVNTEGNDHLDIGQSLFRQADATDYQSTNGYRWGGSALRDPARIQLRFANGQYDSLYLIAASDGAQDSIPLVTAQFFRPTAGFPERFETRVPLATARSSKATRLGVRLQNGKKINLWLVRLALDPGKLSAFSDLDIVEMELTKKVYLYRTWPDPYSYDFYQGGLPSGVHVYAATLGKVPVGFRFEPDKFGHVWTAPAVPAYTATVTNTTSSTQRGTVSVKTRSYDGTEAHGEAKTIAIAPGQTRRVHFVIPVRLNGYHDISATLSIAGKTWTEQRSFVRLAPDTRAVKWEEGQGALFGYWSFHGGHHTPKGELIRTLMSEAGARVSLRGPGNAPTPDEPAWKHWARVPTGAWSVAPQAWTLDNPIDEKKRAAFKEQVIENYLEEWKGVPEELHPDFVAFFPEPSISQRLTNGNYPSYWGEPDYEWTDAEKQRIKMFRATAEIAAAAIHEKWPQLKILMPWGDPLFVVPLLRDGLSKDAIDGTAIDIPGFERMPEMQLHQLTPNRLYELRKEYEKAGISHPLFYYDEGICVPTHAGALSWREQMDIYNRWSLLSMAYGVTRFYSGWNAFDLASYYGAEHYGAVGIQRRIPYCDPKPAYAAYATMTDKLDRANYDGWLPTGSLSTYCLRFKGPHGFVYALWTLRGQRPVTLTLKDASSVVVTDAMNNAKTLSGAGHIVVSTGPSVIYVTGVEVLGVAVGAPDNSDAAPAPGAVQIADLGDGSWAYSATRDEGYEASNFGIRRYQGHFSSRIVNDAVHGRVLQSTLEKQEKIHELMPWYRTLAPARPIRLKGAPSHLGIWVKGHSDWGRVVYTLRDADGEKWISVGQKDDWNNDDTHSWSSFNFDGWRYLRFELPGHLGYDMFRKAGTTWWGTYGGGSTARRGIVDLPLTLEDIKVEQRSHVLYVNDVQPAASREVELGKLYVEYSAPADATEEAVRRSRLRMPPPPAPANLPNPIAEMERSGVGTATQITKLTPPEHGYDGTRAQVYFHEVAGAKAYYVWVSAHKDGRGAVNLTPSGLKNGGLVSGLRPGLPLYYWVVYRDADDKLSRPSPVHEETLVDAFAQK